MRLFTICTIFCFSFLSISSAQITPVLQDLRERVPENPTTPGTTFTLDPTRPLVPLPDPPPPIAAPPVTPPIGQDDRMVFFVHGFGGTRDKWTRVMSASEFKQNNTQGFQARELNALAVPAYQQNGDMTAAVNDVGHFIHTSANLLPEEDRPQNFIIGHSQGGLVGKFLIAEDYCFNNPQALGDYKGLVTFNSALNGAQFVNSRESGLTQELVDDFCNVFTENITADMPLVHFLINILTENGTQGIAMNVCNFLQDELQPIFLGNLETSIARDYRVGSHKLYDVNDCLAAEVNKVAFYGVEPYTPVSGAEFNNPIFYRTIQHFFEDVNASEYWEANDDSEFATNASMAAETALTTGLDQQQSIDIWSQLGGFPPLTIFALINISALEESSEDQFALYRMYHDVNDRWLDILGAFETQTMNIQSNSGTSCTCYVYDDETMEYDVPATVQSECVHPVATDCTFLINQPTTETVVIHHVHESDGVVLAKSAQHMTGGTALSQRLTVLYPQSNDEVDTGSSHMQARNDRNTRDALIALYNGVFGNYFATPVVP